MFEDDFSKMLRDYPAAVTDKKVFAGLMKDLFPGQQMQINLMNMSLALPMRLQVLRILTMHLLFDL